MNVAEHFFDKVEILDSTCWEWKSKPTNRPRMKVEHKLWGGSEVSWALFYGDLPTEKFVLHHCNNGLCVNPAHLYSGTQSENIYDQVVAGTHINARKTHCPQGHEYTLENTYEYRGAKYKQKVVRACKTCTRKRQHEYRKNKNNKF